MSAAQEVLEQHQRGRRRLFGRPPRRPDTGGPSPRPGSGWPLFAMPKSLIAYVVGVPACALTLIGWEAASTPPHAADRVLFAALLAAATVCIEAMRRLGQPTGVSRDLLSAWWLQIALLLPPVYALVAPVILGVLLYLRVRRTPAYRRLFSSAALGLAGAAASVTFRHLGPTAAAAQSVPWLSHAEGHARLLRAAAVV